MGHMCFLPVMSWSIEQKYKYHKKKTAALADASKETGVLVNIEETKYVYTPIFMTHQHNAGKSYKPSIKISNKFF
jgi:hypothetical protein